MYIPEASSRSFWTNMSHRNLLPLLAKHLAVFFPTTQYRLVENFGTQEVFVLIERQNNGRTDFKRCISCNNGIRLEEPTLPLVSSFCA
jgi:hypothetical protein